MWVLFCTKKSINDDTDDADDDNEDENDENNNDGDDYDDDTLTLHSPNSHGLISTATISLA